jgi:hypothetical protein
MNNCLYCGKPVPNKYCNTTCQNKHQGSIRSDKRYGVFKNFTVSCNKCGKEFEVKEREMFFPEKEKYYCSRSCSNTRTHSKETKEKIRLSLEKEPVYVEKICEYCGKSYSVLKKRKKQKCCSKSCSTSHTNIASGRSVKGGRRSAEVQKETRRSKNEIEFSDLCKNTFKNVLTNEPIFNGWDADVILTEQKIAILWNGKWHYEKITKKHSVEQVQNRDKIKIKEIIECGFIPYIIKDMGKYDPVFVQKEFLKLNEYASSRSWPISPVS